MNKVIFALCVLLCVLVNTLQLIKARRARQRQRVFTRKIRTLAKHRFLDSFVPRETAPENQIQQRWNKRLSKVDWPSTFWLSDIPTNVVKCRVFCKNGYHLQIKANGVVSGTLDQTSIYTLFEIQSYGPSIVRIKSVKTGRYLSMKRNGFIKGTKVRTTDSLFREKHEENAFNSFASEKYYYRKEHDMLIGIKQNGKIKRAAKRNRRRRATQFLVFRV